MNREQILEAINQEIAQLQEAKRLLSGTAQTESRQSPRAQSQQRKTAGSQARQGRRQLSSEARKRIADAQKRRWAAARAGK